MMRRSVLVTALLMLLVVPILAGPNPLLIHHRIRSMMISHAKNERIDTVDFPKLRIPIGSEVNEIFPDVKADSGALYRVYLVARDTDDLQVAIEQERSRNEKLKLSQCYAVDSNGFKLTPIKSDSIQVRPSDYSEMIAISLPSPGAKTFDLKLRYIVIN